ncbi:MAG TPA: hypothetical protein PK916_11585, partial [Bacteroidota bacterium]|nr:hypothetical protein [Bacteroidota bacterium]
RHASRSLSCGRVPCDGVLVEHGFKTTVYMFIRHTRKNKNGAAIGIFGFDMGLKPQIAQISHGLAQMDRGSPPL